MNYTVPQWLKALTIGLLTVLPRSYAPQQSSTQVHNHPAHRHPIHVHIDNDNVMENRYKLQKTKTHYRRAHGIFVDENDV